MQITKKDVELAAKLAKMNVSEAEVAIYEEQLQALFKWVAELSAINTDNVKLSNVNLTAHTRKDEAVSDANLAKEVRSMFGDQEADSAKVRKVL